MPALPFSGIERRRATLAGDLRPIPLDLWVLNAMLDGAADSVSAIGLDGSIRFMTSSAPALSATGGQTRIIGQPWLDHWPAECAEALAEAIGTARSGTSARCDVSFDDAAGERCWWEVSFSSCHSAVDRDYATLVLAVARNVTDRYVAVESARLLAQELHHRYCNMLSMIQAIVRISAGSCRDQSHFIGSVEARIDALARNHVLLTRNRHGTVDMGALLQEELAPYSDSGRISLDGPPAAIGEPAASAICLAIHELTSNAVKYGALSCPDGRLRVSWDDEDRDGLRIWWRETGAPASTHGAAGFGSMLLGELLADQLTVDRIWHDDGVHATIALVSRAGDGRSRSPD